MMSDKNFKASPYSQHSPISGGETTGKKSLARLSCSTLKGVGAKIAEKLQKIGIESVQDLLFHLPLHYEDRTHVVPIRHCQTGTHVVIEGVIEHIDLKHHPRSILTITLKDTTGFIYLRFFHFTFTQQNALEIGMRLRCFGEVRNNFRGMEMVHPEYRKITADETIIVPVEENLTPVYPTTEGLQQRSLRMLTDQALQLLAQGNNLVEHLPKNLLEQLNFPNLAEALFFVHRPPPNAATKKLEAGIHPAQQRLAFEELLAHHLSLRRVRLQAKEFPAYALTKNNAMSEKLLKNLAFKLTNAQTRVLEEIKEDISQPSPMLRLVQGDVGSGKTIVALLAMLQAVNAGYQAALMAPTDLLAEQHASNFSRWLEPLNIKLAWLAGKHKGKLRTEILQALAEGAAKIIVGTHALFQEGVVFKNLALIVIDEQHRFGVHQRLALREKGLLNQIAPHQLIMTATPIPRTLAMTAYADLDVSIIDELPPGRTPVKTVVIPNNKRFEIIERIRQACLQKKQAYWVCTLIEDSELLQAQAAEALTEQLKTLLPEIKIALVHGRMKAAEKELIMQQFKNQEIDLLVATTVIEVGVDVPNATLMIIENAERLGLAQLHQLRGRVGRGAQESFCVLMYQHPLSTTAKNRLHVLRDTNDGFEIARQDLKLRGAGELLGTKQTGELRFKIANLERDQSLLINVEKIAEKLLHEYPDNCAAIIERWLAYSQRYVDV